MDLDHGYMIDSRKLVHQSQETSYKDISPFLLVVLVCLTTLWVK